MRVRKYLILRYTTMLLVLLLVYRSIHFNEIFHKRQNKSISALMHKQSSQMNNGRFQTGSTDGSEDQAAEEPTEIFEQACAIKKIALSSKPLPVTALASFRSSGNTWTRHLIQQLTGIGTSSYNACDKQLRMSGFTYECYTPYNRTVVTKTHLEVLEPFQKVVLLIRNPYEAFLSAFHLDVAGHTGLAKEEQLKKPGWYEHHVTTSNELWVKFHRTWLQNFTGPMHVIQYEHLKSNLSGELRELAKFLNVNVTEFDFYCTVKLQEGNFHRKHGYDATERITYLKTIYTRDMLDSVRKVVYDVEGYLESRFNKHFDIEGDMAKLFN